MLLNLINAAKVWYGEGEGDPKCHNLDKAAPSHQLGTGEAWAVLGCSQLFIPIAEDSLTTMFLESKIDLEAHSKACDEKYGLSTDYYYVERFFGGHHAKKNFFSTTNMIFLNGSKDPWHLGFMNTQLSDKVKVIDTKGVHGHSFLAPNEADPQEMKDARTAVSKDVKQWIADYME